MNIKICMFLEHYVWKVKCNVRRVSQILAFSTDNNQILYTLLLATNNVVDSTAGWKIKD